MTTKLLVTMSCYECEHEGDLSVYREAVARCGGVVQTSRVDPDAETGVITAVFDVGDAGVAAIREALAGDPDGDFIEIVYAKRATPASPAARPAPQAKDYSQRYGFGYGPSQAGRGW